ncbi:radical SAM protein [Candidatus Woesearchaeota archaeon]|nr:radical SAM protein [Candidatus Woesearchaeota archaeon]
MEVFHIMKESGVPLIGCIQFGIIDRGTNLIQIRPTTVCNLQCLHCSTCAGELSSIHQTDYIVEVNYLLDYVKEIADFKEIGIEANIDSVGEPTTYSQLISLVEGLKKISRVKRVSMQTNGTLLDETKINALEKAGLDRINLSINALEQQCAKMLSGTTTYAIEKIMRLAEVISKTKIELWICPVWIPKMNDKEIPEIILFAKKIGAKVGIQKYEEYRHSRKIKKVETLNWWKFYKQINVWEKETGMKLDYRKGEGQITKAKRIPPAFKKNEKIYVDIKASGWLKNQMIGVAKNRCVTINNCKAEIGDKISVRIIEDKNEIYLAEKS